MMTLVTTMTVSHRHRRCRFAFPASLKFVPPSSLLFVPVVGPSPFLLAASSTALVDDGLHVSLHVEREVIAAREASVAVPALEGLRSGVLAVVTRKLVRTSESPLAPLPAALVRLFTRMRPLVGFKMRAFGINLLASWKLAFVYPTFCIGRAVLVAPRVMPV